ncbi:MAG: Lrp/AsnC family transcriptional regulator [Gammaproteobacteria bacterium]|nr:Lrp/AsnC family transcriptional regulator [Gammaproteobacteria bacterium]TVQ46384.1 MAG: Lrp/AsnC family transcriptional regulator [Gammaproteobacteria bacterium]
MPNPALDRIDYRILQQLQNDARISNTELAERVGLSPSPCLRRVRALEQAGILKRYVALVDPRAVGLPISVVVNVSLRSQERAALVEFERQIERCPEVMECYLMTGNSDYLLRIVVPDLESYERFLADTLTRIPGVANIQSGLALKQVVYRTQLPLDTRGPRTTTPALTE